MLKKCFPFLLLVVVLLGCSEQTSNEVKWEESATLVLEFTTEELQNMEQVFRMGDNGKLGFGEYGPFIANQGQKYMWHFWGDEDTLTQPFKVLATSKETGEEITVVQLSAQNIAPNNGADHHLPSSMMLTSPGLWSLEAYFGEKLFGTVVVDVMEN
ncbi:hypothetical protein ACQCU1_18955 [Sutcliffiella horikoshii]|uniref:hypothetical protein n=1 Tax=Sutcliffiella horikoshii TaxID=79883 RepID=UPI003CEC7618